MAQQSELAYWMHLLNAQSRFQFSATSQEWLYQAHYAEYSNHCVGWPDTIDFEGSIIVYLPHGYDRAMQQAIIARQGHPVNVVDLDSMTEHAKHTRFPEFIPLHVAGSCPLHSAEISAVLDASASPVAVAPSPVSGSKRVGISTVVDEVEDDEPWSTAPVPHRTKRVTRPQHPPVWRMSDQFDTQRRALFDGSQTK